MSEPSRVKKQIAIIKRKTAAAQLKMKFLPVVRRLKLVGLLVGEQLELGVPLAARTLDRRLRRRVLLDSGGIQSHLGLANQN